MCVTMARAALSDTILYAAEVRPEEFGRKVVHVLGYQNTVENRAEGGNAMILPFPARPRTMSQANVVPTEQCPNILRDMATAVRGRYRSLGRHSESPDSASVEVFDTGIYTVVLASDARAIPTALGQVPYEKRPPLSPALFDAYAAWYPGWTIALCCFNNRESARATPLLWWYEPLYRDRLFAPALDCHTGDVPDLDALVTVNHTVAWGSDRMRQEGPTQETVRYQDVVPTAVKPYLTRQVIGRVYAGKMPNGDFVFPVRQVRKGGYERVPEHRVEPFEPSRLKPPGA
jgi:hypothetical protein